MLILDTHAALWWSLEPDRLSAAATEAVQEADSLGLPSIVCWEASLLCRKKRVAMDISIQEWASRLVRIPRVVDLALTRDIAIAADALEMHPDPADRFIVATALEFSAPILTKDRAMHSLEYVNCIW